MDIFETVGSIHLLKRAISPLRLSTPPLFMVLKPWLRSDERLGNCMGRADDDKTIRGPLAGVLTAMLVLGIPAFSLQLGLSEDESDFLVVIGLVTLPALLILCVINVIAGVRHHRRIRRTSPKPWILRGREEAISCTAVMLICLGLLPSLMDVLYRVAPSGLALIDIPSIVFTLGAAPGFMLILNGGHALRWLYREPHVPLVRINHHLKTGASVGFAAVLCAGIGFVQLRIHLDEADTLIPSIAVMILPSLYAMPVFTHHLICRALIYTRAERRLPYMSDVSSVMFVIATTAGATWLALQTLPVFNTALNRGYRYLSVDLGKASTSSDAAFMTSFYEAIGGVAFGALIGSALVFATGFGVSKLTRSRRPLPASWYFEGVLAILGCVAFVGVIYANGIEPSVNGGNIEDFYTELVIYLTGVAIALVAGLIVLLGVYAWLNFTGRWHHSGVMQVDLGRPRTLNFVHASFLCISSSMLAAYYGSWEFTFEAYLLIIVIVGALLNSQLSQSNLKSVISVQTRQLERDKTALEALDKQKTHFFQTISHELRTPLTLIMAPLDQSLRRFPDNEELVIASNNAKRLLRLVNQLLDFQKVSAQRFELHLEVLDACTLIDRCADYFRSAASGRDITFSIDCRDTSMSAVDGPFPLEVDGNAFEKVVMNYLSNALKYTPSGGRIILGLRVAEDSLRVYVEDSGRGIADKDKESLFKVFSQVDGSTTREFEGTGLGLALAKEMTEGMGGKVGVESEPGLGSTFWAEFPRTQKELSADTFESSDKSWIAYGGEGVAEPPMSLPSRADSTSDLGQTRILVVDDNRDMRRIIERTLLEAGHQVLLAVDGKHGFDVAIEAMPDLIISDWMMPNLSGPQMVELLRADVGAKGIPVVMLTARSDQESKLTGTEVGADAFLGKPFNPEELVSVVRNLLQLKAGEKEIKRLNEYLTESVCKRYLPPDLVQEILNGRLSLEEPAELREITILFSDLKGFTSTSERLGPEGISHVLNEYLSRMNDIIFEHGGTIDKFIGDAIMVIFGAPKKMALSEQADRAVACGLAMHHAMEELSKQWAELGAEHLCMRIGIHQGPAVVGNFGSARRSDYTCIGPTVNIAARIESATEPREVFVSEVVAGKLSSKKTELVGVFELKGVEGSRALYRCRNKG